MITIPKQQKGFTIVELLIVIVVIAILAAITIVAFNGVQQRAKTSIINSSASQWVKLLSLSAELGGEIDVSDGMLCLGRSAQDFQQADGFAAGECFQSSSGDPATYRENGFVGWPSDIKRPNGLLPITSFTNSDGDTFRARGVIAMPYGIVWVPQVNGQCGPGQQMGVTSIDENNPLLGDLCIMI